MPRTIALVLLAGLALAPAAASAKKVNAAKVTCEEFLAMRSDVQPRLVAYLDGRAKSGQKVEAVGEVDVQRDMSVLVVACQQEPKATIWDKVKAKLPVGKKKAKPVAMTCEEYVALDKESQPEVAYFLAGYHKNTEVAAVDEVDLETDTAVVLVDCKPTPKASLWEKLKKHF